MPETMSGTLELLDRGGGYLRSPETNYRPMRSDVFVPPALCKSLRFRGGEALVGTLRSSSEEAAGERTSRPELATVESVNGRSAEDYFDVVPLEDLTPVDPQERIHLATVGGPPTMRVIDLMTPIGLGQRGLIVAPPRTGKTILLQHMAHGVATNHPDAFLMMLLIDERPEEVTEMRRSVRGEVVYSSNDRNAESHVRIARLMIQKAKRQVETGRDVVVFLDSLTRLGRAFNTLVSGGGKIMSGGLDTRALAEPKAIFGAARKIEHGGSLTIIATALVDTGSRMDQVIFNEFKGTGNMEIMLSRELANMRVWPAIDLDASGTRKEEKLLTSAELAAAHHVRRTLQGRDVVRSMQMLLDVLGKHADNVAFVTALAKDPNLRW